MALPKPIVPESLHGAPEVGQHYVECATEKCNKNCQYYCNPCHRPMCEQCREEHFKNQATKNHEVVQYRQRTYQLPVEKCKDHPTKDIDMLCEECQVLLCSKCATANHRGHILTDLEAFYSERCKRCLEEIYKIHKYFLPTTQNLQKEIKEDATEIKIVLKDMRKIMKTEAETLKSLVDEMLSKNLEEADKVEESLMELLQSQDKTYSGYTSYLNDFIKELHGYLSPNDSLKLIIIASKNLETQPIPETTKPVLPIFTAGQYSKEVVSKLLGNIQISNTNPENRKIKPKEAVSIHLKPTVKQTKPSAEKQKLILSSSVTKIREFRVPAVGSACHLSMGKSGRLWVSDLWANLAEIDIEGDLLQNIRISFLGDNNGYHTVTRDGDLVYKDSNKKSIRRVTTENKITDFLKIGSWKLLSIHASLISGDILVGMKKNGKAKITRYNEAGKEIQNIQRETDGQELYRYPHYLTENINGDICTSDIGKRAVVVVNKPGQRMFSYTGQNTEFHPYGICTDVLGHILVCDYDKCALFTSVHLLYQDGQFLCYILTKEQGVQNPSSVCVDDENNLYVGHSDTNIVTVYKYLQ